MVNDERIGKALYNSEANSFFKDRNLDSRNAKLVQAQTMHAVFYISGNGVKGAYVKLSKKGKDGTPDRKEIDIEAQWYNVFRKELALPGAPLAKTFMLDGEYALVVEEVPGETGETILRRISTNNLEGVANSDEFNRILERSAEISARGYILHKKSPEVTQVFFRGADGGFDAGEFDFLNGRTIKIMGANGRVTEYLFSLLSAPKSKLVSPENRAFYRDATPLNWVDSPQGIVAIDLGSTSYRPPQFELVALLETPETGISDISPNVKEGIIRRQHKLLLQNGLSFLSEEDFVTDYALASFIKNSSGTASRIDHIAKNRAMINSGDLSQQELGQKRISGNIAGKRFHAQRAIDALNNLKNYFESQGLGEQARKQKELFTKEIETK